MKRDAKVLFVCLANVARSQMAEAFYNHYTHSRNALSAGVMDFREKYHYLPHKGVVEVMGEKGVSMVGQRMRLLDRSLSDAADVIVVFCDLKSCPSFIQDTPKTMHIPLFDPGADINGPDDYSAAIVEGFRRSRDEIDAVVRQLLH